MTKRLFLVLLFACSVVAAMAQYGDISVKNVKKYITDLSSDAMLGRGTGEQGEILASEYIAKYFKKLGLKAVGDSGYFQYFEFTYKKPDPNNPHAADSVGVRVKGRNVVGYLDNGADYTIIVGAHYDHLGEGHYGHSLDTHGEGKIHNGADDNASGTSGVMELARIFADNKVKEDCNFIFICFSGEELGLVGSKRFTERVEFDSSKIQAMINMDMIGRLKDSTHKIQVSGIGTSPVFGDIVQRLKPQQLNISIDSSGTGPTDHTSFYLKNIPVLSFFTGQHKDYHKPTDDAEFINYEGEVVVLEYIKQILIELAAIQKPDFTKTVSKDQGKRSPFKVTLGIMPDYTYEGKGVKIDGVIDNKPAQKAGIIAGDVLIKLGDFDTPDIYKYMEALGKIEPGSSVSGKVQRGVETIDVTIQF